jgi:hypothetical protein
MSCPARHHGRIVDTRARSSGVVTLARSQKDYSPTDRHLKQAPILKTFRRLDTRIQGLGKPGPDILLREREGGREGGKGRPLLYCF